MPRWTEERLQTFADRVLRDGAPDQPTSLQRYDVLIRAEPGGGHRAWVIGRDISASGGYPMQALQNLNIEIMGYQIDLRDGRKYMKQNPKRRNAALERVYGYT